MIISKIFNIKTRRQAGIPGGKTGMPRKLLCAMLMAMPVCASAQLTGAVTVEGDYLPDILHPDRINMLPPMERFSSKPTQLEYSLGATGANFSPAFLPLPSTAWDADRTVESNRGYLRLRLGSWLNSNLSAGYNALHTDADNVSIWLQHNSTSLWRPFGADTPQRWSYQESLGADWRHTFKGLGVLEAALQYRVGCFNYYGFVTPDNRFLTQTLNDAAFRIDWTSDRDVKRGSQYNATLRGRAFNYRIGDREFDLGLSGGYSFVWDAGSRLGIDADIDVLLYSQSKEAEPLYRYEASGAPRDYALITLTPFYAWQKRNMSLRLGLDIDIAAKADGTAADRYYGALHFAPDVRFDVRGRRIGFYASATGGSRLQTLASLSDADPYRMPWLATTCPVYTPIDAALGVEFGPFSGFSAALSASFRNSRHIDFGGWFAALLNYGFGRYPGLEMPSGGTPTYGTTRQGISLAGVSVGLDLRYSLGDRLSVSAGGTFQPQNGKTGFFNGYDRPKVTADASLRYRPIDRLTLGLEYNYRGLRKIYTGCNLSAGGNVIVDKDATEGFGSVKLSDQHTLNFSASWQFNRMLSVDFRADNLVSPGGELLPGLRRDGRTFYGGVSIIF